MKNGLILLFLCFAVLGLQAQNISVKSFQAAPEDMTARVTAPVTDQNGDKCALIKVRTSQKGFVFDGDMNGITKTKQDVGEIWVYLPQKSRKITIKHQQLGVLDKYIYPEAIKEAMVYIMELTCGKVTTIVEDIEIPTQWVVINSSPEKADLYFDEKYIGQTPITKKMPIGKHTYRLEKTLYHNAAGTFDLQADNKHRIEETLKENFGFAHISTSPEDGAEIIIDGQKIRKTSPAKTDKLLSGEYELTIRKDLYKPVSRKIVVKDNETSNIKIVMEANFGSLDITTSPVNGAAITLDGKPLAKKTPYTLNKLTSGEHTIKIHKEWYEPKTIKVNVIDGEAKLLPVILTPTFGQLNVTTSPEADIYIDEKFVAKGECKKRLITGFYTIETRQEKHHSHKRSVEIIVGDTKTIELNPTPKYGVLNINSEPFDASIILNGIDRGTTPNTIRNLLVGDYTLGLKKDGFLTVNKTFTLTENQTLNIKEVLQKKLAEDLTDIHELERLAEQQNPQAMALLGYRYYYGYGVEKDYKKALSLYRKSADAGYAKGQSGLARMYSNGKGVVQDHKKASFLVSKAVKQGDASGQNLLGWMYLKGKGVKKDISKAIDLFEKAAEQEYALAQYNLGKIYHSGNGVKKDYNKAILWYRKAAENGFLDAQNKLGIFYKFGKGIEKDFVKAVMWFRKAAERGYVKAQTELGIMYKYGMGVEKDDELAVKWYRKAADQGYTRAILELGIMYDYGRGVTKDQKRAVELYKKTAEKGHAPGQYQLAYMYCNGEGVTKSNRKAVFWMLKSAEQGFRNAQNSLGIYYANGKGVKKDHQKANEWYRKAAEQGYALAQFNLGLNYEFAKGVSSDYKEAVKWYEKSAQNGYYKGQYRIGKMYELGKGVKKDLVKAREWYQKAADQGCEPAQDALKKIM